MSVNTKGEELNIPIYSGTCFIEQILSDFLIIELVEGMVDTPEQVIDAKSHYLYLPISSENFVDGLVESYYYNFNIYTTQQLDSIKIDIMRFREIKGIIGNGMNEQFVFGTFDYNFKLTKEMVELVTNEFSKLKQIERFHRAIIDASYERNLDDKYEAWSLKIRNARNSLLDLLETQDDTYKMEWLLEIFKSLRPFFDAKKWTENDVKIFISTLNQMRTDSQITSYPIYYSRLLGLPGLGLGTISTVLHCLWEDTFVVYSQEVFHYIKHLGFFENVSAQKGQLYEDYRKGTLEIINSLFIGLETEPNYNAVSYYFKKFKPSAL